MKLLALALAALMLPLAAHATPAAGADDAPQPLPAGCRREAELVVCQWTADSTNGGATSFAWPIPPGERTLAHVIVRFRGQDFGWYQSIRNGTREVSHASHSPPQSVAPDTVAQQTADHLLLGNGSGDWSFVLRTDFATVGSISFTDRTRTLGNFNVTYIAEELPDGVAPARPAASRDMPQLVDPPFDALGPGTDIVAAWFDDPLVGDGLFDVHYAVRDLPNLTFASSNDVRDWVDFTVRGTSYELIWELQPGKDGQRFAMNCWIGYYNGNNFLVLMVPACSMDVGRSTLTATIPERVVGSPGPRELFTRIDAGANNLACNAVGQCSGNEDVAVGERFAFALGGPAVWDDLNGCAFCTTKVVWYRDPFAVENLPNTLQVLGALVAVVSFAGGFVVLRRNRRATHALVARVDALVASHEQDARAAIHALAELERDFTELYRSGKINESQYQVATQRVVAAASRFALRRELGLDRTAAALRVPVEAGSERGAEARP